ncbi:MAG: phosphoribosylaminoimidazolesuccinocarboxamide synthase [Leptospiraceae bacterium]|nr:phosphoribosylaminoimidazolesuccinocarboxamide synthase [Leptospiraceae bacterium]MCB1315059.1 phosphoribosylaminoimidazolesuccinocarboxamide synthase [Leptospiraceae bacterium]
MNQNMLPAPDYRGKVRDLYFINDEHMLIQATDRLSAFDVVFDQPVPDKGKTLTRISNRWFEAIRASGLEERYDFSDHVITSDAGRFPPPFQNHPALVERSVLVKRTERIDFECVVRGYLAGSGWKDYQKTGAICGHKLPAGLRQADRLPEPIFTPATKAPIGDHDENVDFDLMRTQLGPELAERLRTISLAIYTFAAERMQSRGILLCDTKFEFGLLNDRIVLIDEILTPDSSRYWNVDTYAPGSNPPGYDKQYVRDFVEASGWNKRPPAPQLPPEVIEKTVQLYRQIEQRIIQALQ